MGGFVTAALMLRERWAVDDPYLDFLEFMHDKKMYEEMAMATTYVTEVGEVAPDRKCRCGDAAELHTVVRNYAIIGEPEEDAEQFYDACGVQGCNCQCYEEAV
jgi:hypothetical protein